MLSQSKMNLCPPPKHLKLLLHPISHFSSIGGQAVRAELSLLTQAFAEKSSLLSDCLSQAAASKATLEAKRISVGNAHTEGIR